MSRIFVDTSAWCALFNTADPDQPAVTAVYTESGHEWFTSNFVVDELLTLLDSRVNHGAAVRAGRMLRAGTSARVASVLVEDENHAWGVFERLPALSFTDCTSFVLMRRLGIRVALTLDEDFRRCGFVVRPP